MFVEQEGLSDFIDKNIEKELHIQCAGCAKNRIITNHQKPKRKSYICHNLLTKKTTTKYRGVYLWALQFIASFWETRRKFAKYLKKQLSQNMNNYHLIILPKSQKWLLVNPHLWTERWIERCGGTQCKVLLWYVMVYQSSFIWALLRRLTHVQFATRWSLKKRTASITAWKPITK